MARLRFMQAAALALGLTVAASAWQPATAWAVPISKAAQGEKGQFMLEVDTLAGSGRPGDTDGTPQSAAFRAPQGLLVMEDGTVYIGDTGNHQVRKLAQNKVSTAGGVKFFTDNFGNPQGALNDGSLGESAFNEPGGLASDGQGNIYVADAGNHAIRKLDKAGKATTLAGNGVLGSKDGKAGEAQFYYPQDVAVTKEGVVYVADSLNHLIRRIAPNGEVSTLNALDVDGVEVIPGLLVNSGGYRDGKLEQALFNEPSGLALDAKGNLYVSDTGNQLIRYIDFAAGKVSTVAGSAPGGKLSRENGSIYAEAGFEDGAALQAKFNYPRGLAVTSEGGLLIADSLNHAIRYLHDGQVSTVAGNSEGVRGWSDGIEGRHGLQAPSAVAVMQDGTILVADSYNNKIRQISLLELPERAAGDLEARIIISSKGKQSEMKALVQQGRTYAPVRALAEALGYEVTYETETREVKLEKDGISVALSLNAPSAHITDQQGKVTKIELDAIPPVKSGTTYIPVRAVSELIGMDVQWLAASKTAVVRNPIHGSKEE
ncbi:copper amine oxidase [Paenibacillaceae bacterium]|nr:copper amine oxidase [Paenibacillaceae bacterium]